MSFIFGDGPDTSAIEAQNKKLEADKERGELNLKRDKDRVATRRFSRRGRRSLITTSEEGLSDTLG